MRKRILSILLTLCMLLSAVPMMGITASAEEAEWLPVTFKNGDETQCNSTCEYRISADGTMTIRPKNGISGELPSDPSEDYGYTQISWCWDVSQTDNEDVVKKVIFEDGVKAGNTLYYLFINFTSLESIDFSGLDTTNTKNMAYMLDYCLSLESVTFGENFNTSNVTTMYAMFGGCQALTTLDLSKFNTSSVTTMSLMFSNCAALTELDVKNFDTSSVTDMSCMFEYCSKLEKLDLSSFDTSNVEDLTCMFNECQKLNELDLSSFSTAKVGYMGYMFYDCSNLTELNLSGFDTATVSDMSSMFENCTNLKTIYASDAWTAEQLNSDFDRDYNMFSGCTSIVGGNGTTFDSNNVNKEYARIDAEGNPGYLTKGFNITNGTKEENKASNNGYISVAKVATEKATVTVTATPDDGYAVDTISAYKTGDTATTVTVTDGTFTMPAYAVTVSATFKTVAAPVCYIDANSNGTFDGDDVKYETITAALAVAKPATETAEKPTVIRMIANSNENITVASDRFITLDLGGYVLKGTGNGSVITNDGGTLNITDTNTSKPKHYFTEGSNMLWNWNSDAEATDFYVEGGVITGGSESGKGGGGIRTAANGTTDVSYINIVGNQTQNWGGGLRGDNTATYNISDTNILHNYAESDGGAANFDGCYITVTDSVIKANYTGRWGGGFAIFNTKSLNISGCTFDNNVANSYGGSMLCQNAKSSVTVTNSNFKSNTAKGYAGALRLDGSFTATIDGCTFTNNSGTQGGAIKADNTTVVIKNSTFTGNSGTSGGAMQIWGGSLSLTDTTVTGNSSTGNDGGIFANCNVTVVGNTVITGNKKGNDTYNLYLKTGKTVTVSNPGEKLKVGVTLETGTGNVTAAASADYAKYFTSDNTAYTAYNFGTGSSQTVKIGTAYTVTCADTENGSFTVDKSIAGSGDTITVTVTPDACYQLDTISVYKTGDINTTVTVTDGKFTMPAYNVTVSATFKLIPHTHAWTYTAGKSVETLTDNDTITATCTDGCTYAGTDKSLTITAPTSLTYDSSAKAATFGEATTFCGSAALPSITYQKKTGDTYGDATTDAPIDAGTYKASFTVGEGADAKTASVEFTIAKAKVDVPTAATGLVYNGKEQTALTIAADALYTLDTTVQGYVITATDAGSYSFQLALKNKTNYEWKLETPTSENQQITWSIAKAKVDVPAAETNLVYTGDVLTGVILPTNAVYTISDNTATDAGTDYKATVTLKNATNYKWNDDGDETDTREIAWSIAKAEVTLPTAETNLVYDGTVQTGVKCPENAVYTLSDNTATNAGTNYEATASLGNNAKNYKWAGKDSSDDQTIAWSIAKRTVTLWSESGSKQYDMSPLTLPTVYADENKNPVDSVFANDVENLKATGSVTNVSQGQVTNTISYTYKTGKSADNFDITSVNEGVLSIYKAGAMSLVGAGYTGAYDGKEHTAAAVPGVTEGTTVTYSTSTDNAAWSEYSATVPQITDAGTLYVKAKAVNADYNDAECTYTLTVTPAKVTVPTAVTGLIYNGTEQIGVILPESAVYTISGNTGVDAKADYSATVTLKDKKNYVWEIDEQTTTTDDQTIAWSIVPFTGNTITELTCAGVKKDGTPAPTAKATYGEIVYTYSKDGTAWDTWENTYSEPGEYYVKATVAATANYDGYESEPVTFRVGNVCEGYLIVKFNELCPGEYKMFLNNTDTGTYKFTMVIGGYTIQNVETGKYICLTPRGGIVMRDTCPTVWAKGIASFHASPVSTGNPFFCARYYLNVDCKGNIVASVHPGITHFAIHVEADEHCYCCAHDNLDGTHTYVCAVCGHSYTEACTYDEHTHHCTKCDGIDMSAVGVNDVKVSVNSITYYGFFNTYTLYIADICPDAFETDVMKVEYSTDDVRYNSGWKYSSRTAIDKLWIRVTDERGIVTKWLYDNGTVTKIG